MNHETNRPRAAAGALATARVPRTTPGIRTAAHRAADLAVRIRRKADA